MDTHDDLPIEPEELSRAEKFFEEKLVVLEVSKEKFIEILQKNRPNMDTEEILQAKGINFDLGGGMICILLRTDVFPPEYMPYMATHEKWEAFVGHKDGFNLFRKAARAYVRQTGENILNDPEAHSRFVKKLSEYEYEYRHEFAIYKEYQQAQRDGKLEEYHQWMMDLREKEKPTADESSLRLIENDTKIRLSVFKKLTEGTSHYFRREEE